MKALNTFYVSHGKCRIRVRVLPSVADVHREYSIGECRRDGKIVHAFFFPARPDAMHVGTAVFPLDGQLEELIPHEVVHAVMHKMGGVHCTDDEALATTVGILSARIARKIGAAA
jgi:hypothetical protein